jgi:branched-chain amino acid transport system substrate-binding protein
MLTRRRAALITAAMALGACSPPQALKVGFISGQTGPFSDLGSAGLNGAILAVEQRNARGGVGERPVKLLIRDDEHNPAKAQAAFHSLLQEAVVAIIGPMTSAMATELAPLANQANVVLMGGTVVTHRLNGQDDYFLRAIASTPYYAAYTAGVHQRHFKPARVTVVFDAANRDYAQNWARDYANELTRLSNLHPQIIEVDSRTPREMASLATRILASRPELVTFATSARTAAMQMRDIRRKDERAHFATSAWAANHLLLETAEQAAEGALVEQYHDVAGTAPAYLAFAQAYRDRFKLAPDYAAVVAFDATNIVLHALSLNPQRQGLKQALLKQQRYTGLQVPIELDRFGDASRAAFTTVVKAGQFTPLP